MSSTWNGTIWEIEQRLSDHYLRSDGPFGAADLRYLDATDEELARALAISDTEAARQRFLACFHPDLLREALQHGRVGAAPRGVEGPGFFRYLVLTCVIACTSEDSSSEGDFRRRLSEQLELNFTFVDLRGVAEMWRNLKAWCAKEGSGQFRKIDLPVQDHRRQIGYTLRIAFPARVELRRMERLFGDCHEAASPAAVIKMVSAQIYRHNWSQAFVGAFDDFSRRYKSGHRLLASHPFWLAIRKVIHTTTADVETAAASIEITTDIEGDTIAVLKGDAPDLFRGAGFPTSDLNNGETYSVEIGVESIPGLLSRCTHSSLATLAPCYAEGIIAFEELAWGAWRAVRTPDTTRVRLLVRPDLARRAGLRGTDHGWLLTSPVTLGVALAALEAARPTQASKQGLNVAKLMDGVRIGKNYLGRSCCMPSVSASASSTIRLRSEQGATGAFAAAQANGSTYQIISTERVSGKWVVEVDEGGIRTADLRATFLSAAVEHVSPRNVDLRRWVVEMDACEIDVSENIRCVSKGGKEATQETSAVFDLLEGVYAGGEDGWSEQELLPILHKAIGTARISPWDALWVMADSGFIEPRLSTSWRARKWFLRPARIIQVGSGTVLLDGAVCETTRLRFDAIVRREGGRTVIYGGEGWFVPISIAFGVDAHPIAEEMGLPASQAQATRPKTPRPVTFEPSPYTGLGRHVAGVWSWRLGRFITACQAEPELPRIERLQHNENHANDVFRVTDTNDEAMMVKTRNAAILLAHRLARLPLFNQESAGLRRLAVEGHLPLQLADYLRLKHLRGPWLKPNNARAELFYPADISDVRRITQWLPNCVQTARNSEPELRAVVLSARGVRPARKLALKWAEAG